MTPPAGGALLVVVDMQRVFAEPDSPWYVPAFASIIEPIRRLIGAFGDRVVFTRFLVPDDPQGSWADYYREWSFVREPRGRELLELAEPWTSVDHPVIDKTTFSAFGPELQSLAGPAGEIVVCGVSTECCVLLTTLDAVDAGISARLVSDACASVDPAAHDAALRVATVGFAPMVTVTTVDAELARRRVV